jgi:hypothetical protein
MKVCASPHCRAIIHPGLNYCIVCGGSVIEDRERKHKKEVEAPPAPPPGEVAE